MHVVREKFGSILFILVCVNSKELRVVLQYFFHDVLYVV
jgi:hypothetical protein